MTYITPAQAWKAIGEMLSNLQNPDTRAAYTGFHCKHTEAALTTPASVNMHHCWPGGYAQHIYEVMANLRHMLQCLPRGKTNFTRDDALTASYVHDLDKLLYRYEPDTSKPSSAQLKLARDLGIPGDPLENRNSISDKIDAAMKGVRLDPARLPRHNYRESALDFEDSGIVMHLCVLHGLPLSEMALHAVAVHHGGFSPLARTKGKLVVQPLGALLHAADYISSQVQDGLAYPEPTSETPTPVDGDEPPPPPVD